MLNFVSNQRILEKYAKLGFKPKDFGGLFVRRRQNFFGMFACEGVDFVILKPSKILENVNEKLLILGFSNQNIFEPRAKNFRECT